MTTTETALSGKVYALLLNQFERGIQLGSQVCAYRNGEVIVDTWAGEMGPQDPRPVLADTLFSSFSTTKGPAALALHILGGTLALLSFWLPLVARKGGPLHRRACAAPRA